MEQNYLLFEDAFANFIGVQHCIGVGNGLDALTLILQSMKDLYHWEDGAEVIVPAMTFIASAQAIVRANLTPVFSDVSSFHYTITPELLSSKVTKKPELFYLSICMGILVMLKA